MVSCPYFPICSQADTSYCIGDYRTCEIYNDFEKYDNSQGTNSTVSSNNHALVEVHKTGWGRNKTPDTHNLTELIEDIEMGKRIRLELVA